MRTLHAAAALPALALLVTAGCQQKMAVQPSYRPNRVSDFFDDGRTDRPLPGATVARGHLRTDRHLFAGEREGGQGANRAPLADVMLLGVAPTNPLAAAALASRARWLEQGDPAETFPFPVTKAVLEHGRHRFMIFCVVCHDPLGTGHGMIVQRGFTPPPSYHIERLRKAPPGHFFQVISLGYGSMPSYGKQIPPRDRWAIAAYIRALQHSQHFRETDLTDKMRNEWDEQKRRGKAGGKAP